MITRSLQVDLAAPERNHPPGPESRESAVA